MSACRCALLVAVVLGLSSCGRREVPPSAGEKTSANRQPPGPAEADDEYCDEVRRRPGYRVSRTMDCPPSPHYHLPLDIKIQVPELPPEEQAARSGKPATRGK